MDYLPLNIVLILASFTGILVNFFLLLCMFCPQKRRGQLKQTLKVLLVTLVSCHITLQLFILFCSMIVFFPVVVSYIVLLQLAFFTMRTSVTSSFWLNVFYFCKIVPAQYRFFIRLKRNIRFFIYSALIADKIFFLFGCYAGITCSAVHDGLFCNLNATYTQSKNIKTDKMQTVFVVDKLLRCCYLSLCLCAMLALNCVTIRYLRKHTKNMQESNFTSVRFQRQMRVTFTGIIQTFLSLTCFVWMMVDDLLTDLNAYIGGIVACFYSLGTTINLCVGQTIFRRRADEIYQKCQQKLTSLSH